MIRPDRPAQAVLIAERRGVVSGLAAARAVARVAGVRASPRTHDGATVFGGNQVLRLSGSARRILGSERTMLNLLMHLSGVATATAAAVRAARRGGRRFVVLATRKTLPGLRDLEKQAVVHGGGAAHRRDLSDAYLIKSPHLELVPVGEAVRRARRAAGRRPVEVEVRTPSEARQAADAGADQLLVDNRSPAAVRAVVRALGRRRKSIFIEVSGGITARNIGRYAAAGADGASLGSLTHSAPALPFHLRWTRVTRASPPS